MSLLSEVRSLFYPKILVLNRCSAIPFPLVIDATKSNEGERCKNKIAIFMLSRYSRGIYISNLFLLISSFVFSHLEN
jgi:hypothetical protein